MNYVIIGAGPAGVTAAETIRSVDKAGKITIKWMLGGGEHDPLTGKIMSATAELKQIKPNADYLGVYLYEDGTVALDTARGIPDNKFPPATR